MNVLAIDTSSDALVLGLQSGRKRFEKFALVQRSHSREVLPAIMGLLGDAGLSLRDLGLILYGQGPGSFTGLRIAVGVVQGLAYGLDIPVTAVSSLACLAQGEYRCHNHRRIVVALTARKEEVFFGLYEVSNGIAELIGDESVVDVKNISSIAGDDWVGIGSGWRLKDKLQASLGRTMKEVRPEVWPRGTDLLDLGLERYGCGEIISAMEAAPEYLREQVATPKPRNRGQ